MMHSKAYIRRSYRTPITEGRGDEGQAFKLGDLCSDPHFLLSPPSPTKFVWSVRASPSDGSGLGTGRVGPFSFGLKKKLRERVASRFTRRMERLAGKYKRQSPFVGKLRDTWRYFPTPKDGLVCGNKHLAPLRTGATPFLLPQHLRYASHVIRHRVDEGLKKSCCGNTTRAIESAFVNQ